MQRSPLLILDVGVIGFGGEVAGDELAAQTVVVDDFDDLGLVGSGVGLGEFVVIDEDEAGALGIDEVGA